MSVGAKPTTTGCSTMMSCSTACCVPRWAARLFSILLDCSAARPSFQTLGHGGAVIVNTWDDSRSQPVSEVDALRFLEHFPASDREALAGAFYNAANEGWG